LDLSWVDKVLNKPKQAKHSSQPALRYTVYKKLA